MRSSVRLSIQKARYGISVTIRMVKWNQSVSIALRLFSDKKGEAVRNKNR